MASRLDNRNPYVGPRPFETEEQDRFFGRDRETRELLALIIAHPAVLLYAQSGAGKTSLLNARLIPWLAQEDFEVFPIARVSGAVPQGVEPPAITNLYVYNTLGRWTSPGDDPRRLVSTSLAEFLQARPHLTHEAGERRPRVLLFDQFEELFSFYPDHWQAREPFFQQVAAALEQDPLLRVVFAIREDYLAQLDPYVRWLPERLRARFRLERLREAAALEAVKRPLEGTGRRFAPGVAENLVRDLLLIRVTGAAGRVVETPGEFVEPVQLQVVCSSIWTHLPSNTTEITPEHMRQFGDIDQALATFYESAVRSAARKTKTPENRLREWCEQNLVTPLGTRGTVLRQPATTGGIPNAAVDELERQHLIRAEDRAGARWYELTHDRFIGPIQESNATWRSVRFGRRLRIAGAIAAGLVLLFALVAVLLLGRTAQLETEVTQTDQQSRATATVAAAQLSAARATVEANRLARIRPLKSGHSVSAGNLSTAGTLGAFARDAQGDFYLLSLVNIIGRISASGGTETEIGSPVIQPGLFDGGRLPEDVVGYLARTQALTDGAPIANMVALACLKEDVNFDTAITGVGPLRGMREAAPGMSVRMLGRTSGLTTGTISETNITRTIAGLGPQGSLRLVNGIAASPLSKAGDGGALVVDDEGYAVGVVVAASPNSTILAPIQNVLDRLGVQLVYSGQELLTLRGHQAPVRMAQWSPDGTRIVTAGRDESARLWDGAGHNVAKLPSRAGPVTMAAFNPDGKFVVTAGEDNIVRVWEANTGQSLNEMAGHTFSVISAAFSPDGKLVVTGSNDGTARVWETGSGRTIAELHGHISSVDSTAFSPDGKLVATASGGDRIVRLWDATTWRTVAELEHPNVVGVAAFSPDGKYLVTVSLDNTAYVWDVRTARSQTILRGHTDFVHSAAFSPDGKFVVTASRDGSARVWEASTGRTVAELRGHTVDVQSAAFSPDGKFVVTASSDQTARVWESANGQWLFTLSGHTGEVFKATWSPDGLRIVTAGADGTARVWQGR